MPPRTSLGFPTVLQLSKAFSGLVVFCGLMMGTADAQQSRPMSMVLLGKPTPSEAAVSYSGYFFIDGVYVAPPYTIERDRDLVRVNDVEITAEQLDLSDYEVRLTGMAEHSEFRRRPMWRGPRMSRFPERSPMMMFSRDLANIQHGGTVILRSGSPPLILDPSVGDHSLLQVLCQPSSRRIADAICPPELVREADRETWMHLIDEFEPTAEFLARAEKQVQLQMAAEVSNEHQSASLIWSDRIAFPLTTFAILIVVLAFGHLLSSSPMSLHNQTPEAALLTKTNVVRSLGIIALLSAIDLIWTLTAHQTGMMRELNPLGNQIITNPSHLILFKVCITATSIGLLYRLHHLPIAQRAAWWCCLILTLLTARWLTFQSMFI
ncbi:hypothetical protein FYK55_17440 [Roseiconus nitratireducens]|uniref:DUF5658 domain-containing protein n=1 Tax=Roseiconus nitratireducens TaxID=2605748 RepID=A0A5M6D1H6_9BACT|nr:DUF5658 family protein [Roseiconus nitratireducens]KAA5541357.1 hypothetical protein FYK55_17440 [Roseiconus nitratireducens]